MTIEEYTKQRLQIEADLREKKITQEEAGEKMAILTTQHPQGLGMRDMTAFIAKYPTMSSYFAQKQEAAQAGELKGKFASSLMVLADLGMTAAALRQISVANQAAATLNRPEMAPVPGYNPQLTQAIYEAQRGVVNPNALLDPAKQQIQQGYLGAQQANQIASGGQAGMNAALNQVANLQRMQAALGLAPLAQGAAVQNRQNLNQLLGMRMGETQNMFANQQANSMQADQRYRFGAQAAGMAGSSGRQNLMDAAQRLAYHLGNSPASFTEPAMSRQQQVRATPFRYPMNYQPRPIQSNKVAFDMLSQAAPQWVRDPGLDPDSNDWIRRAFAERSLNDAFRMKDPNYDYLR